MVVLLGVNALLIFICFSEVTIGIFCIFGSIDDIRPVDDPVWLYLVWILFVLGLTNRGRVSRYVDFSFDSCLYSRTEVKIKRDLGSASVIIP